MILRLGNMSTDRDRGKLDASRVRGLAKKTKDGPEARRLLALEAV
jgi:hypothetical protein